MTAIKEISQGFAHRLDPTVLCSYDIDCGDVVDLTAEQGRGEVSVTFGEIACAWASALAKGQRPVSWSVYDRLVADGVAGIIVPSFAPGAEPQDCNLVLWNWGPKLPHKVEVFDPSNRLRRDQLSWD